jgi:adenylate cyclase
MQTGTEVDATIMFVDVRNFTTLSRDRCKREVARALNRFYGLAVPAITENGGYIDKFTGDGLMAVFSSESGDSPDADRALAAALEMDERIGPRLDGWIEIGIGLDSGPVLIAAVGCGDRVDVTLIGHAVNIAAHVEALTRETGDRILLTGRTRKRLTAGGFCLQARRLPVSGESRPLPLFAAARPVRNAASRASA